MSIGTDCPTARKLQIENYKERKPKRRHESWGFGGDGRQSDDGAVSLDRCTSIGNEVQEWEWEFGLFANVAEGSHQEPRQQSWVEKFDGNVRQERIALVLIAILHR